MSSKVFGNLWKSSETVRSSSEILTLCRIKISRLDSLTKSCRYRTGTSCRGRVQESGLYTSTCLNRIPSDLVLQLFFLMGWQDYMTSTCGICSYAVFDFFSWPFSWELAYVHYALYTFQCQRTVHKYVHQVWRWPKHSIAYKNGTTPFINIPSSVFHENSFSLQMHKQFATY